jgi:hypothetical protein
MKKKDLIFFSTYHPDKIDSNGKKENKYRGKYLAGNILEEAVQELFKHIEDNSFQSLKLIVGRKPGKPEITARIALNDKKKSTWLII